MKKLPFALGLVAVLSLRVLSAATITAELSADETSVGMPVELMVQVAGTTNVTLPRDLGVDGLQSQLTGRSTQVSIINGRMTTSGLYSYTIVPMREGTFEIPPLEINADGKKQRTTAQKLVVTTGRTPARAAPPLPLPPGSTQPRQPAAGGDDEKEKLAYAELIVPRESVYVGEVVPAEVRFSFNQRVRIQPLQREPQVSGEGFTVQKFSPPERAEEAVGDAAYTVFSFKTGITAVKSGEMELPKASMQVVAEVPARSPRGMNDIFSQMFGGQGMPGFTEQQELKVETKAGRIRVKALPVEGRPPGFSGAVGEFTAAASVDAAKTAPGDPITLKIAISGRGNFDGMGEPKLVDAEGWRVYPPTDKFEKSDDIGFTGTKTFEMPLVAQRPQTRTPVAEFSYFDPVKEKYFTIRTLPVAVEAAAKPEATPGAPAVAAATPAEKPGATPAADAPGRWLGDSEARSWTPLVKQPVFWIGNGIAGFVFLAWCAVVGIRRARSGPAGRRAAVARERDQLLAALGRPGLSDADFLAKANEALARQAGLEGESGPFELVRSREAHGQEMTSLHALLARTNESKFSGGGVAAPIAAEERRRIAAALREMVR